MNLQQFQYILAVAEYKHFELAAEKCFITQSTLSTMISRFEDEIGIKMFDRKKKPVELTTEGKMIVEQIKIIANNVDQLKEVVKEIKGEVKGNVTISVIPTIAPFLLPLFLRDFAAKFPNLKIIIREETTQEIIKKLKSRELDIGILSIPLDEKELAEIRLYDEPFVLYSKQVFGKTISVKKLQTENLCLMEEGHCMRTQVMQICDLSKKQIDNQLNFDFKAGSIDSLLRFVNTSNGSTLLPYLSTINFSKQEKQRLSQFSNPVPYRTIGLVVHRHFVKKRLLEILQKDISDSVSPMLIKKNSGGKMLSPV